MIKKNDINIVILFLMVLLSSISYIPNLNMATNVVYILFMIMIVINLKKIIANAMHNKDLLVFNTLLLILYGIYTLIHGEVSYLLFLYLIVSQIILLTLMNSNIDKYKKEKLLIYCSYTVILSSILIVLKYQGSYIYAIKNIGQYFMHNKNAFSPMLSFSIIYICYNVIFKKFNIVNVIVLLIGMLNLIIIQSRTNVLMTLCIISCMILTYICMRKGYSKIFYSLTIISTLIVISLIFYNEIRNIIFDIFRIDYFLNTSSEYGIIDKLTTGRVSSFVVNLHLFENNVLFGSGFNKFSIINDPLSATGIHNVWIRSLFYGGIIYLIIILMIIRKLYLIAIKYNFSKDIKLIVFVLLGGLINSNFEPFAPFGPGTSYILFWIVIAININSIKGEYKNEKI